jgi:hypothetical protein
MGGAGDFRENYFFRVNLFDFPSDTSHIDDTGRVKQTTNQRKPEMKPETFKAKQTVYVTSTTGHTFTIRKGTKVTVEFGGAGFPGVLTVKKESHSVTDGSLNAVLSLIR